MCINICIGVLKPLFLALRLSLLLNGSQLLDIWLANMKHEDHPDPLFTSCAHSELEERKWIPIGMVLAFDIKIDGQLF